ncbi:protein kinase [Deinococcus sp.]|uniref:protein kinase domain-containing protein n=1 Tax=Deinococcus sp. TaxID=47478 RepID=UPI0025BB1372|nr:protein kinase [Deinococcus sp.]
MANCPVCGSPVGPNDTVCRTCGSPLGDAAQSSLVALPPGTTLGGQYGVTKVLGQGGFGITYDGQDTRLGLRVAIKEMFLDGSYRRGKEVVPPSNISTGEYHDTKKRFLDEAKVLASFNDPGIVRVLNYFEENSTAYLVMEFLEGTTLGHAIEKRGPVPPDVVLEIARSLAHTLELVHGAGLLHRDIKPDNIFLHKSGRIVLIDFGSARSFAANQVSSHTRLVTPGYAPLEQYSSSARFGPYTDLYALGATLVHALTGQMPPAATDLVNGAAMPDLPAATPTPLVGAITKMMALRVEDRPQSAHALLELLSAGPAIAPAAPPPPAQPRTNNPTRVQVPPPPPPSARPAQPVPQAVPVVVSPAPVSPAPVAAAPASPTRAPAPAPNPVPALPQIPAPVQQTAPPPTLARRTLGRDLLMALGVGFGVVVALSQVTQVFPAPVSSGQYLIAGLVGAVAGLILGALLWFAMPVVLPLGAAAAAYFFAQQAGLHWPTVISLSVMATALSIIFLKLIRRISW